MLRVGLTGGIGSGKSTIAQIFEALDIPVYYADAEAKRLMNTDAELKKSIVGEFGEDSYKNGTLNRAYIAAVVFNNKAKLDRLNVLVHPAVMKDGELWMAGQTTPYAIHEAALIFEAGVAKRLDYVIGVFAPQPLRIKRTMERDKVSHEEVAKRMSRQLAEEIKMKRCDFVITNDEQQPVIPQVMALHEKLLALSIQK
jgi:dephospho-CoA kinase